jgi:hypothetical protein
VNNFKNGFVASVILSAIPLMLKLKVKKLLTMLLSKDKLKDSCKLAIFAGLINAVFKAVLCLIRRLYPADQTVRANQVAAPIAGFLAGLTLVFENKFRKQYLMIIALSRCIDSGMNLIAMPKQIEGEEPVVPDNTKRDFVLWMLGNAFTQYYVACDKSILNVDVAKFYSSWARMTKPDMQLLKVWHRQHAERSPYW